MTGPGVPENIPSSDLFKAIVETTCTAHFIISGGRVIYANPAFETLTGYSAEELAEWTSSIFFQKIPRRPII